MKQNIYTIPISEAFSVKEGCPFCRLYSKTEENTLDYALGGAMMEVHERSRSNELGFCSRHYNGMRELKNRLSLGLMTSTHLEELLNTMFSEENINGKVFINPKMNTSKFSSLVSSRSDSCYICDKIEDVMKHYYTNALHMWKTEPEFRELLLEQEYFCLPHLARFVSAAQKHLIGKKNFKLFVADVLPVSKKYAEELHSDSESFCLSFDHRNAGKPLSEKERIVIERTRIFINGVEDHR